MSREIKFRVWDSHLEVMHYESQMYHELIQWFQDDRYIKRQYTGLEDKNEVEAYEADTVDYEYWIQTSVDPDSLGKTYKGKGVIEFIAGCFMINPTGNENPVPMHYADLTFDITGNIHQPKVDA